MKYLIIAEKPELGRAIEKAIPCTSDGSIVPAGTYRVLAARGHLMELQAPEDYDPALKEWTLEQLPIYFRDWQQKPKNTDADIARRLKIIKEGLAICDCVIHAGDPDDEGQLLIDEILNYFHNEKPVYRLLINDLSPDYIRKRMRRLEPNEMYVPLGVGAYARSVADYMFGINYTRYFTKAYNAIKPLSVGRVQTPTLGLVVNRDAQIENHVQRLYCTLSYDGLIEDKRFPVSFVPRKDCEWLEDDKVFDRRILEDIRNRIPTHWENAVVTKSAKREDPPLPFNLVKLQTFCGSKMHLSPAETLAITQTLREQYNLITYNRSDCQYLNDDQHKDAPDVLRAIYNNLCMQQPADIDTARMSKCFNSSLTTAHHAIIPTQTTCDMSKLTEQERDVYRAIAMFYMFQFLPPKMQLRTLLQINLPDGHMLQSESLTITDAGWYGHAAPEKAKADAGRTPLSDLPATSKRKAVMR